MGNGCVFGKYQFDIQKEILFVSWKVEEGKQHFLNIIGTLKL